MHPYYEDEDAKINYPSKSFMCYCGDDCDQKFTMLLRKRHFKNNMSNMVELTYYYKAMCESAFKNYWCPYLN